jgi:hypothetical protein
MASITGKSVKLTVVLDLDDFPFSEIPPLGTPGGKERRFSFDIGVGGRVFATSFKGAALQRFAQSIKENPQGGTALIQGKLSDDGKAILEAGIIFQPTVAKPVVV